MVIIFDLKLHFNKHYFFLAVLLLFIEVLIALFVNDSIIRPYGGDLIVVVLIYCTVKAFLPFQSVYVALGVLCFAYTIEVSQYFSIIQHLGLGDNSFAKTLIGTRFSWGDMLAYTLALIPIYLLNTRLLSNKIATTRANH